MNLDIRITSNNAHNYIGRQVLYKSRGVYKINTILYATSTQIGVNNSDLGDNLNFNRRIFLLPL